MKRIVYAASSIALLSSVALVGNASGRILASHPGAPARALTVVKICTSTPYGVPALKQLSQGIRNGVTLAIKAKKTKLAKAGVRVVQVNYDYAKADHSTYDPTLAGTNARDCIGTPKTLGMVGTLNSGAALVAEPIENKAHLVTISPANTNPALTSPKPVDTVGGRVSQEPCSTGTSDSCPSNNKIPVVTYYRTVTTDKLQGPAGALFAYNRLHARSFYLVDDGLTYGVGLATYFGKKAKALGMTQKGKARIDTTAESTSQQQIANNILALNPPPDVVYCGCDSETSTALPRNLRHGGYHKPYMGGDALYNSAWLSNSTGAGPGAVNNDVTSVGPDISKASLAFQHLYSKYLNAFYKNPGPQAYDATSYDAATAILLGIWKAAHNHKLRGTLKNKRTWVTKYVRYGVFSGATGTVSFDKNGDTKNKVISVYHSKLVNNALTWKFNYQLTATGSAV